MVTWVGFEISCFFVGGNCDHPRFSSESETIRDGEIEKQQMERGVNKLIEWL